MELAYKWSALMDEGAVHRAAFLQEVAAQVWPDSPSVFYRLAISYARAGDSKQALDVLEQAAVHGMQRVELLDGEAAFAPLRGNPRFVAIRERILKARTSKSTKEVRAR